MYGLLHLQSLRLAGGIGRSRQQPLKPLSELSVQYSSGQQSGGSGIRLPRSDGTYRRVGEKERRMGCYSQMYRLREDSFKQNSGGRQSHEAYGSGYAAVRKHGNLPERHQKYDGYNGGVNERHSQAEFSEIWKAVLNVAYTLS